jgi:hypothetical protein
MLAVSDDRSDRRTRQKAEIPERKVTDNDFVTFFFLGYFQQFLGNIVSVAS